MPKPLFEIPKCSRIANCVGKFILNLSKKLEKPRVFRAMRFTVIFLLMLNALSQTAGAQEVYDNCINALELCPNETYSVNNISANATSCVNCEDDFNFCFDAQNSVWFTLTSNAVGGLVNVNFTNLIFETNPGQDTELQAALILATSPCDAGTYTQLGTCFSNETGNFTLNANLAPLTSYYLVVDGDNNGPGITDPAECRFDLSISGVGVDRNLSTLSISQSTENACLGELITFNASTLMCPNTGSFQWYVNDVLVAISSDSIYQTTSIEDGDIVSVITTCYAGCPDTLEASANPISVYTIDVDAGNDVSVPAGTSLNLSGSTSAPIYSWSPDFAVSDPNILNPIVSPGETTTFTLTAQENGCTRSDYVTISIDQDLFIPNTFSPNQDQVNDSWIIEGIEKYPDNLVSIYTRWGQRVFQTTAYSSIKNWDGEEHLEGVYYYVIELNDGSGIELKGTLTLLR